MNRFFTKTFFGFFVVFLIIIAAAFGVLLLAASHNTPTNPQDQIAQPAA